MQNSEPSLEQGVVLPTTATPKPDDHAQRFSLGTALKIQVWKR